MATIQLNVEGNVGELLPNLQKVGGTMDTLQKKTVSNAAETQKAFKVSGQYVTAYNNALKQGLDITAKASEATAKLGDNAAKGIPKATEGMKSFKTQLLELTKAAQLAQQQFKAGLIDEKTLIASQQRVANLKEEIQDFGKRVDALNPEAKFNVITQATQGLIGGFQAATGAIALFGGESEDVQKAILKMQAVMNFSQGINQLLQLKDVFGNLAAVLGITTTAQKGLVVATEAQAAAAGVATTATVVEAGATQVLGTTSVTTAGQIGILRTAINLLLGPLGIILAAFGAVIALWAVFQESGESNADMLERMTRETEALNNQMEITRQRQDAVNEVLDANTEILRAQNKLREALAKGDIELARVREENAKKEIEDQKNKLDVQSKNLEQNLNDNKALIQKNLDDINALQEKNNAKLAGRAAFGTLLGASPFVVSGKDREANNKAINDALEANKKLSEANAKFVTDKIVTNAKLKALDTEGTAEERIRRSERAKDTEDFNKRMIELNKSLVDALAELQLKATPTGTPTEQLTAETDAKLKVLADFRDKLIKIQQDINDAEAQRTGKPSKKATLDSSVDAQFTTAQNIILQQAAEKQIQIEIDKQIKLVELRETGQQKEIDLFLLNFKKKEKELLEAGATEVEIEENKQKEILKIQNKYALEKLEIQKNESDAAIDQVELSGVSLEQAEKIKAQKRLEFDLMQAEKRLQILVGGDFTDKELSDANEQIRKLTEAVNKGKQELLKGEPFSLAKVFGIDPEHFDEFNAAAQQFADSFKSILLDLFSAEEERVNQHLENNQKLIDSDNERISELEAAIEKDTQANKRGLANNLNLHQQQLAALKQQRDKDLAEQKKLQEEKRKLAQQQAIIEAAETASSLTVSTINVIKSLSGLPFGIGVVLGLAAAASLVAGFLAIKSQISAASQSFGEGGEVDGEPHSRGGNKYRSIDGRSRIKEIEEGEWLTKKRVAQKKKPLLKAMNDENEPEYRRLMFEELFPFLKSQRIGLSDDVPEEIYQQRQELSVKERTAGTTMAMAGVEKRLDSFHEDFTKMLDDRMNEEHHHSLPDGSRIITKRGGKYVEIIRKQ
jgi:hypothetical protein